MSFREKVSIVIDADTTTAIPSVPRRLSAGERDQLKRKWLRLYGRKPARRKPRVRRRYT